MRRVEFIFLSVSCIWIPFPSSLLSTVECGGCTTLGFLGSPIKFNSPTEVVGTSPEGCDLHETSTERDGAPVPTSLLVVFNFTQRGPSIPCTDPELSTTLVDGPTVVPLMLRHSHIVTRILHPQLDHILWHRHGTAGTSDTSIAVLTFVPDGWVQGQGPRGSIFRVPGPGFGSHPDPQK